MSILCKADEKSYEMQVGKMQDRPGP